MITTMGFSNASHSCEPRMTRLSLENRQTGVTLIEVLVTLLVLSIGLVGIALLQLNSLKFAHSAYYTSVATSAAVDLEERLWVALGSRAGGCLDANPEGDVDLVVDELKSVWATDDPSRVGVPRMEVEPGAVRTTATFTEVPITLSWDDARFADENSFPFTARVVCFEPPPPPDEEG